MDLSRSSGDEGNIAFKSGDMNEWDVVNQPYTKLHFAVEWHFREVKSCLPGVFGMQRNKVKRNGGTQVKTNADPAS